MKIFSVSDGIFFQSSFVIQACLIPVFFILRAGFEYGADAITSHTFGSDGMPAINFFGVDSSGNVKVGVRIYYNNTATRVKTTQNTKIVRTNCLIFEQCLFLDFYEYIYIFRTATTHLLFVNAMSE